MVTKFKQKELQLRTLLENVGKNKNARELVRAVLKSVVDY